LSFLKPILILLVLSIITISFKGCKKNETEQQGYEVQILSDDNFESIHFINDTIGYISGGNTFYNSKLYKTVNGGNTWDSIPTNVGKTLYHITSYPNNKIFVAGFDAKIVNNQNGMWQTHQVHTKPTWMPIKQIAFANTNTKNYAIACGGIYFNKGILLKSTDNFLTYEQTTINNELHGLAFTNDSTIIAVGYGLIVKSNNYGRTWENANVEGDVYVAIDFANEFVGYVVGEQGSILKTIDGGINWQYLRKANSVAQKRYRFAAVYFIDELNGFITGEKGILWQTEDGGENWQIQIIDKTHHYTSITTVNQKIILVGKNGVVVQLTLH